jgi:hypothetical protein
MPIALASKPGLSGAKALSVPDTWSPSWFRWLLNNLLKGADVRNAIGANGITVSGNISSPYATIGFNPSTTTITAPAAGGAGALPATPAGYVTIQVNGVNRQVAYY